jgi:hypothetical protein
MKKNINFIAYTACAVIMIWSAANTYLFILLLSSIAYLTLACILFGPPPFVRVKTIYRDPSTPYLIRYSIFSCRWFAVKVHNILVSDDDCFHDHPWSFITFLISGKYQECHSPVYNEDGTLSHACWKNSSAGSLLYRPIHWIHRLEIIKPVWSIVITFKKKKPWGFYTKDGWVEWFNHRYGNRC